MGLDFLVIWHGLTTFLTNGNPYTSTGYFYPPAFTLLFAPLGLLPVWIGYILLTALTLVLGYRAYGKEGVIWLAFAPVFYVLLMGNVDLLFVILAAFIDPLPHRPLGRRSAFLMALLTLKPQLAVILLPYFFLKMKPIWGYFLVFTALLWGIPALLFPDVMRAWWNGVASGAFGHAFPSSAGLWSLSAPYTLIAVLCVGLLIVNRWRDERFTRVVLMLVSPLGQWNGLVALLDCAPIWLLSPVSLIALYAMVHTDAPYWWAMVPAAAFLYHALLIGKRSERYAPSQS
jgi:glycosyl transferase family 87